ncbi:MAG: type II secretion system protein [Kiritimatiellae bacterium]|nr:type II secretion system protein [Kiritimatiellia bacterium]
MRKHSRSQGFTIVEMLMVLGIIAVLLGLVTSAAMTAIRHAREKRTAASLQVIQAGIATYRSQNGEWPGPLKGYAENGLSGGRRNYTLNDSEYDQVLTELVKESVNSSAANPMMDVTGLIVSPKGGNGSWGVEFREAIKKQHKHGGTIKLSNMAFGYLSQGGKFSRFKITYNADSDHVTVSQ